VHCDYGNHEFDGKQYVVKQVGEDTTELPRRSWVYWCLPCQRAYDVADIPNAIQREIRSRAHEDKLRRERDERKYHENRKKDGGVL